MSVEPTQEQQLRRMLQAMPIPIMIVRQSDGEILFANGRMDETFATPASSLVGRKTTDFYINVDDRQRMLNKLNAEGFVRDHEVQAKSPAGKLHWVSVSLQPLIYDNEPAVLGSLVDLTERKAAEFSLEQERRLLTRLLELNERDRQLIGFEIHDGIVQDMTGCVMFIESAIGEIEQKQIEVPESLTNVAQILRECINEARRLIGGLQPPVLDEAGVVSAIHVLAQEAGEKAGIEVLVHADEKLGRLAPPLEMAIYRIVQESLNNMWQHALADNVSVELRQEVGHVLIRVTDDGVGFDTSVVKKKRYGLMGIRERARLFGGQAEIHSAPGKGTQVIVNLPLDYSRLPIDLPRTE